MTRAVANLIATIIILCAVYTGFGWIFAAIARGTVP